MAKLNKEVVNQFVVCGKVLDITNFKEGNIGQPNEYFGFTVKVLVDEEANEVIPVEFFTTAKMENRFKSFDTLYSELKTVANDGEEGADVVRITGKLTDNSYYSKGELVKKMVLSAEYCNRKKDKPNDKFVTGATFKALALIDKVNEVDDKLVLNTLINNYKSKNGKIAGENLEIVVEGDKFIKGFDKMLEKTESKSPGFTLMPVSGKVVNDVEIIKVDESELIEEDVEDSFGDFVDEVEERNAHKRDLKENGIRREHLALRLTGAKVGITKEEVEEKEYPYDSMDIEDMWDIICDKMLKNKERDASKMGLVIDDGDVPF